MEYGLIIDGIAYWMTLMECWCHYTMYIEISENTYNHQEQMNLVFENCNEDDVISPLTVMENGKEQKK